MQCMLKTHGNYHEQETYYPSGKKFTSPNMVFIWWKGLFDLPSRMFFKGSMKCGTDKEEMIGKYLELKHSSTLFE